MPDPAAPPWPETVITPRERESITDSFDTWRVSECGSPAHGLPHLPRLEPESSPPRRRSPARSLAASYREA